jgi:type III secretion protein L
VFESDHGVIDAGLETQLAAIQRAVQRASQQVPDGALALMEIDSAADDEAPNDEVDATALPDDSVIASPMQAA